ncbi:type II toxin-antitoxin system PemK/MazF family toxin [Mycetohabitans sp. B46]|uniref:type II toxin-antitoxin system PemK/MazF family toxin n=1 Tax=Mycetohabitans sp. B46 TaxID=2772536 RepID=UPI00307F8B9C
MKDLHPMLVLSPKPFNERTGMVLRLAMTTADFNDTNPFATKLIRGSACRMMCSRPHANS